jgi:hypothetical protein
MIVAQKQQNQTVIVRNTLFTARDCPVLPCTLLRTEPMIARCACGRQVPWKEEKKKKYYEQQVNGACYVAR